MMTSTHEVHSSLQAAPYYWSTSNEKSKEEPLGQGRNLGILFNDITTLETDPEQHKMARRILAFSKTIYIK